MSEPTKQWPVADSAISPTIAAEPTSTPPPTPTDPLPLTLVSDRTPRASISTPRRCHHRTGSIASVSRAERQNDMSQAGRSIWRTMTPAVLKMVAAPMA